MKTLSLILLLLVPCNAWAVEKDDFWFKRIEQEKKTLRSALASGDTSIAFGVGGYFIDNGSGWESPKGYAQLSAINELCTGAETKGGCYDSEKARYQQELQQIYIAIDEIKKKLEACAK